MIRSRAQFGYRGVIVALFAMVFTYMAFNVADQVLLAQGLHNAFGWNANLVAIVVTVGAALLAIYGYDWVHRLFRWTLYILLPLMVIVTIGVIAGKAGGVPSHHAYGFNWVGFMSQSPPPRPTTSPTRATSPTTRATCQVARRAARSSGTCSPAPRLRPSG
jgi:purine-cytosine permease-like protein